MNFSAKKGTINIAFAALFTAVICVLSQIAIPMPSQVPLTMQTFAVALCGFVLGAKWGFASITAYVFLGAVGVPVFAGFKGGIQNLFGMTGGFIYGFIVFAVICGLSQLVNNKILKILIALIGLAICHILGVMQFSAVYGTSVIKSFLMVSAPYLIKDIISVIAAFFISIYIRKKIDKIH